jgi:hypothetical protein
MILEIVSIGLLVSALLALFFDEMVYSVVALAGAPFFTAILYTFNNSPFGHHFPSCLFKFQFLIFPNSHAYPLLSGFLI